MSISYLSSGLIFIFLLTYGDGWKAVPANHAMYARRSTDVGREASTADDNLPKNYINSIYKFGDCGWGMTKRQFLRSTVNVSFDTFSDSQGNYMYILSDMTSTQRFQKQCVVLKTYVPRKYLFWKSRMPLYYCQGQLYIMVLDTINRLAIHEFFSHFKLSIPADMYFEFYHPDFF